MGCCLMAPSFCLNKCWLFKHVLWHAYGRNFIDHTHEYNVKHMFRDCTIKITTTSPHDVIKWKHFPRYWPFVWGIHRSPVNSLHKGQWRGALMFSLICTLTNGWVNNREAGDLRRHRAHYDFIVMQRPMSQTKGEVNCRISTLLFWTLWTISWAVYISSVSWL